MTWLPEAMRILRGELPTVDVTVSSDYSPDLAEGLERGRLDLAFLRADQDFDLTYQVVGQEPLVVLMPSDHPSPHLTQSTTAACRPALHRNGNKAKVVRGVIDAYLKRSGVEITPHKGG